MTDKERADELKSTVDIIRQVIRKLNKLRDTEETVAKQELRVTDASEFDSESWEYIQEIENIKDMLVEVDYAICELYNLRIESINNYLNSKSNE